MQSRSGNGFCAAVCLALLLSSAATISAGAQEPTISEQPSSNTTISEIRAMPSWSDLEAASAELSSEANLLLLQAQDLNKQLAELQSSLMESTMLLAQSLAMRKLEDQAAQLAIKSALNRSSWWMRASFVAGGALVGALIDGWKGAVIGAGAGIASDAAFELSVYFRIFR